MSSNDPFKSLYQEFLKNDSDRAVQLMEGIVESASPLSIRIKSVEVPAAFLAVNSSLSLTKGNRVLCLAQGGQRFYVVCRLK